MVELDPVSRLVTPSTVKFFWFSRLPLMKVPRIESGEAVSRRWEKLSTTPGIVERYVKKSRPRTAMSSSWLPVITPDFSAEDVCTAVATASTLMLSRTSPICI
jgi:hypothetical protein